MIRVTLLLVLFSACGSPSTPDASVDLTKDIQGDFIDRFTLPDGSVLEGTLDVTALTVSAFSDSDDGGFEVRSATGRSGGRFVLQNVPQGRYSLAAATTIISTEQRETHFGQNRLGRPLAQLANPGEGYRITATNLAPWHVEDEVQFFSWNAGIGFFSTSQRDFSTHRPDAGQTTLSQAFIDFGGVSAPETAQGDWLTVTQLHVEPLDSGVLLKMARRTATVQKSLLVGTQTSLNLDFTEPAPDTATLGVQRDQFTPFLAEMGFGATLISNRVGLSAHPGSFDFTVSDGTPDLMLAEFSLDAGLTSVTGTFGNVFPQPAFQHFVSGGIAAEVSYSLPTDAGRSLPRSEVATVSTVLTRAAAANQPLAPLISPVKNVKLDGAALFTSAVVPTGVTPTLTWEKPTLGTLTRTDIDVFELSVSPQTGGTNRLVAGSIKVLGDATRFHVPPGVFVAGRFYVLRITAIFAPRLEVTAPLRQPGPPVGTASTLTAVIAVHE